MHRRLYRPFPLICLTLWGCGSDPLLDSDPDDKGSSGAAGDTGVAGNAGTSGNNPDDLTGIDLTDPDDAGVPDCNPNDEICDSVTLEPACGDSSINQISENCDDGNGNSGDGCTANCQFEEGFYCATPGQPCVSSVVCGDGRIGGAETCDDGDDNGANGCSATCQVEDGWGCPVVGLRCQAAECGDGIIAGVEECDFASSMPGCVDCRIVDGYDCNDTDCNLTACHNGVVERGEQCEDTPDGETDTPFDGCYACRLEPSCSGGSCEALCGDGQRFESEACDDGNLQDGDGCSADCEIVEGYACEDADEAPPQSIELPIILRDFIGEGNSLRDTATCYNPVTEVATMQKPVPCFHIDFNGLVASGIRGCVLDTLDASGRPQYQTVNNPCASFTGGGNTRPNMNGEAAFSDWFDSDSPENLSVISSLPLDRDDLAGTYVYDATNSFYPLDGVPGTGLGWVATGDEDLASGGCPHNNSFTTETHFWFEYAGGESFAFSGDDDTWVFVNGTLAVDLGGLHGSKNGSFELDPSDGTAAVQTDVPTGFSATVDLGLELGGIYELVMFQAERNECGSNFKITLKDFSRPVSTCASTCGDGIVASDELCDDGPDGNDGAYGHCGSDCLSRGPYCGDGDLTDGEEQCDDGFNLSTYGQGCGPGCTQPPTCGDGLVQSAFEQCDDGDNDGGYGGCDANCVLGPRCGDGSVQSAQGEQCDDGNRINADGCNVNCVQDIVR